MFSKNIIEKFVYQKNLFNRVKINFNFPLQLENFICTLQ